MIQVDAGLWVGDSHDGDRADESDVSFGAVLCVAQDLEGLVGWGLGIEYMQVGLIDGPGNVMAAYHAAVLALVVLMRRHEVVLVYCHTGGRALAVAIMYLCLTGWRGWGWWENALRENNDDLPQVHEAHRAAFDKINWRLLNNAMGD